MRPVFQRFAEKRIRHAKENVGQRVGVARRNVLEVGVVDGIEWAIVGAVGQRVDDGGEMLHRSRAEGGRGRHYNQRFCGEHELPQRVDVLHNGEKTGIVEKKVYMRIQCLNVVV